MTNFVELHRVLAVVIWRVAPSAKSLGVELSLAKSVFTNFGAMTKHKHDNMKGSLKPIKASDVGLFMRYASTVGIMPGYGLAISQGQQNLSEFVKLLRAAGVGSKFAVHPLTGRMPGPMDVLLAEAGVPYELIFQLASINDEFENTDVTLMIDANDVVNRRHAPTNRRRSWECRSSAPTKPRRSTSSGAAMAKATQAFRMLCSMATTATRCTRRVGLLVKAIEVVLGLGLSVAA